MLLAFSGCRFRVHNEGVTPYSDVVPPAEYEYTPPEEEAPTPPDEPTPMPQTPAPPEPDIPDTPPDIYPEIESEYIPLPHIEAEEDNFSPQMMEVANDDARQYASEEGPPYETDVGVETANNEDVNVITINAPAESTDEEQSVLGDDGGVVGIVESYAALLRQGVNTLFPCQLLYVYSETSNDLVTVSRGSAIYQLTVSAGGMNVSSRLASDRLTVDADWVVRRNPDVIVKFVDSTILGNNVTSSHAARDMHSAMLAREGWSSIEAIRNNRVILLSEQMIESDEGRLAAKLLISRLLYPELFLNMDVDTVVAELIGGMGGIHIYFHY